MTRTNQRRRNRRSGLIPLILLLCLGSGCHDGPDAGRDDTRWLSLEIPRPDYTALAAAVEKQESVESGTADGEFVVKAIIVPPNFLDPPAPGESTDPFAASATISTSSRKSPQEMLESFGIEFEPGAFARLDPTTGKLLVRLPPDQMDLVEAVTASIGIGPESYVNAITIRTEIYELRREEGEKITRSATEHYEHTPERDAVRKLLEEGRAALIQSANVISRSGQRARFVDGYEVSWITPFSGSDSTDSRVVGTFLEIDPVLGADEYTVDLNYRLEHHTAPPDWENPPGSNQSLPRFHLKALETVTTMRDEEVKLVGRWESEDPAGGAPRLQLVFLQVTTTRPVVYESGY